MGKFTAGLTGLLVLVTLWTSEALGCDQVARPAVHISMKETPVEFDLSLPVAALNRMQHATPYPSNYHAEVGGVMNGEITLNHKTAFTRETNASGDKVCVVMKVIEVELSFSPTIYIASDLQHKTCLFKEIFAHESQHVDIDRDVVRKYQAQMTDGMNMMLMMPGDYSSGWIDTAGADHAQDNMQAGIENALAVLFNKMMRERNERQLAIDTQQEYGRITRSCQVSS